MALNLTAENRIPTDPAEAGGYIPDDPVEAGLAPSSPISPDPAIAATQAADIELDPVE
jgi:hypothetical protein